LIDPSAGPSQGTVADIAGRPVDELDGVEPGTETDPRFSLANDRTLLAWNRTALALIGAGLAVAEFLKIDLSGAPLILALPLIALGGWLCLGSYRQWQRNEEAMRLRRPLPRSAMPQILVYGVAGIAITAIALAIGKFA
jgi:putative membrane protein